MVKTLLLALLLLWNGAAPLVAHAQLIDPNREPVLTDFDDRFHAAYLGVSGPLEGQGKMGHTFIVFTEKLGVLEKSNIYEYYPTMTDAEAKKLADAYARKDYRELYRLGGHLEMTLNMENGYSFIETNLFNNRRVSLYKLDITQEELKAMKTDLDEDMNRRQHKVYSDYSMLTNNCATLMVDLINRHVPDKKRLQIGTNWKGGKLHLNVGRLFSADAWLAVVPVAIADASPRIELFDKALSFEIKPVPQARMELNLLISKALKKIGTSCGWEKDKKTIIRNYVMNNHSRVTVAFNRYLKAQLDACTLPEVDKDKETLIDSIIFDLRNFNDLKPKRANELAAILKPIVLEHHR